MANMVKTITNLVGSGHDAALVCISIQENLL